MEMVPPPVEPPARSRARRFAILCACATFAVLGLLRVARAAWAEPHTITLVRDVVSVVSVESKLYDHRFGYVKIKNFQDRTDVYLKKALDALRAQSGGPLAGVVLDLRHNPGGLLEQA